MACDFTLTRGGTSQAAECFGISEEAWDRCSLCFKCHALVTMSEAAGIIAGRFLCSSCNMLVSISTSTGHAGACPKPAASRWCCPWCDEAAHPEMAIICLRVCLSA